MLIEKEISFEQLPKVVYDLRASVNELKQLLLSKCIQIQPTADELLTVQDTAKFLTLSIPTIYGLISKGAIPCMKRSKRVYFSKNELINYLQQGKKKAGSEIQSEADTFLSTYKRKGGIRHV